MIKTKTRAPAAPTSRASRASKRPAYLLRSSPVHGSGLFATRAIKKGVRIIEYVGEHISHEEADRRHEDKAIDDNHTFLFTIDAKTVIDADVGGNEARFINHSCDPNCEVVMVRGRPFVEAVRAIVVGEELAYDYHLNRAPEDPPNVDEIFACHCGAKTCRGTMLVAPKSEKSGKSEKSEKSGKSGKATKKKPVAKSVKKSASKDVKKRALPKRTKRKSG